MPSQLAAVLRYFRGVAGANDCDAQGDGPLLRRFAAERDEGAFAALLQRHGPLVFEVCRRVLGDRHDAEDAFQAAFLVLAKKAASVRRGEALAAWLHRVALNVSRTLRAGAAVRRAHERQAALMAPAAVADQGVSHDWQPVLHEEVDRLPEKYRVPVVVCYFQGATHEEAARRLGWPVGSVKGRLARARDLLRARLTRRGLAVTGAGLAAALAPGAAAAVPPALLGPTLRAAVAFAAGGAATGCVNSARTVALAKGVLRTMSAKTWTPAVVLLMAAGFAGVGVALAAGSWREGNADAPAVEHRRPAREDRQNVVEKDGVRFEILVPEREWLIPENRDGVRTPIKLGLRITNETNKPLRFTRFDTLYPEMTGPDGKPLQPSGGRNVTLPMKESDCPLVKPGDGVTFAIDAHLFWQGGKLRFGGSDGFGGIWGFADEFKPGRYRLRIGYTNAATEHEVGRARRMALKGIWTGEVKTPFVEVSLVLPAPAGGKNGTDLAESRPVRVSGLEFVALVQKRMPVPTPEGVDVTLGLRIRNVSDKPLTVSVFDVIRPWVSSAAEGRKLGASVKRKRSPKPLPPVTLAPGASWTWQPRARILVTGDRATICLRGPDGLGVPGFWEIATLRAGKNRLSVEYANGNPKQGDVPVWVGKAVTEEVEFEIGPGEQRPAKPAEDAVKDDLRKLQGTWRLVAAEQGGIPVPPQNLAKNTWVFTGDKAAFKSGLRGLAGTVTLDPSKNPRWIDVKLGSDMTLQGIYELNGDTLRLFFHSPGAGRPTEFKTREGDLRWIGTYRRGNPDPQ